MAFGLHKDERLPEGVERSIREQVESAIHHLSSQEADPVEAVHETRKALKRVRMLLRLLRRASGEELFAFENRCFGDLARKLGTVRDAQVLSESAAKLAKLAGDSPFGEAVRPVEQALREHAPPKALGEELLGELVSALERGRARLTAFAAALKPAQTQRAIESGLRRMVRLGHRAYRLAYGSPSDEHTHAWRKRVKDLYYAACLLHLTRPKRLAPLVDLLDGAADALGEDHDLALLANAIHAAPQESGGAVPVALVLQLISRRRGELRQELALTGRKLYRRSARRLTHVLTKGLET